MTKPFGGTISVDIRASEPDWTPFEPPRAPDGAPNVLYIVLDDVGFSAMSCYGGPIETPNIDRIVSAGVRYTQFHTTALCSPTRSLPVDRAQPHAQQHGLHHRAGDHEDITDKAFEFIRDAKAIVPDKPFCLYYAPGACHAPHPALQEWSEKFKGRFDMGHEAIREQTLARQKELGIVPANTEVPPINPIGTPETRQGPDGLDDRTVIEVSSTPRPQLSAPRERYVYFPGDAPVGEWQAVNTKNRSFVIEALTDVPDTGAQGVLFAFGTRFGGHALYVKDNRLHYVNSFVGAEEQLVVGSEDIPAGENLFLPASFEKQSQAPILRVRDTVALSRRHQARGGRDQDPARLLRDRRLVAVRRAAARGAGDRRLPRRVSIRIHGRPQAGLGQRQRQAVHRPRTPRRDAPQAPMTHALV
jgi:hypothetical protein